MSISKNKSEPLPAPKAKSSKTKEVAPIVPRITRSGHQAPESPPIKALTPVKSKTEIEKVRPEKKAASPAPSKQQSQKKTELKKVSPAPMSTIEASKGPSVKVSKAKTVVSEETVKEQSRRGRPPLQ